MTSDEKDELSGGAPSDQLNNLRNNLPSDSPSGSPGDLPEGFELDQDLPASTSSHEPDFIPEAPADLNSEYRLDSEVSRQQLPQTQSQENQPETKGHPLAESSPPANYGGLFQTGPMSPPKPPTISRLNEAKNTQIQRKIRLYKKLDIWAMWAGVPVGFFLPLIVLISVNVLPPVAIALSFLVSGGMLLMSRTFFLKSLREERRFCPEL